MTATVTAGCHDADKSSMEVTSFKLPKAGDSGKESKPAPRKSKQYLRRRSSVQMVADAARREAGGIIAALGTGLAISGGSLLISLVEGIEPLAVAGLRSTCAIFYVLPALAFWRPRLIPEPGYRVSLVAVSVVLAMRALCFTLGSVFLPLAEFSLLLNTMPLFTAVLGCSFLGETCGAREIASGVLVFCGVVVAFLPTLLMTADATTSGLGIAITLACAIFQATSFVILRRLSNQSSPLSVSLWSSLATSVICLPPSAAFGQLHHLDRFPWDLLYTAGAGVTGLLSALLPAIACSLAEAGKVAIATTSSVVFSFALQAAVQLKAPTPWAIVGAAFIVSAVVCSNLKFERPDVEQKLKDAGIEAAALPVKDYGALLPAPSRPP